MKPNLKTLVFLLIFSLPSAVFGKTFTNCGGDFSVFLKETERYATGIGISTEVLKKTIKSILDFTPKKMIGGLSRLS